MPFLSAPGRAPRRVPAAALLTLLSLSATSCDGQRKVSAPISRTSPAGTAASKGPGTPTVDHTLMDRGWSLPYGTVKLPAGWGFNGGVVHGDNSCAVMGDAPMWAAESADKSYGIVVLPTLKTGYTSDAKLLRQAQGQHCPMLRSTSGVEYLTQYVLPHLHGGNMHILSTGTETQLAPMAAQFRQMQAPLEQTGNNQFTRVHGTVEAARVLLQYQEGGRTFNERAVALFACTDTQVNIPMSARTELLDCSAPLTIIAHAPSDGTPFNDQAIEAHSKDPDFFTVSVNPAWTEHFNQKMELARQQVVRQNQQTLEQSKQNMANQQARFEAGQQQHRQQQQMYDQQNAAWRARQNKLDESQQAFNHYLSGTNVYTNAQTGQQYEMSNQYNNTYINQNGNVGLQTNSATSPGVDWTLLVPKY